MPDAVLAVMIYTTVPISPRVRYRSIAVRPLGARSTKVDTDWPPFWFNNFSYASFLENTPMDREVMLWRLRAARVERTRV
jgi:hypothetical protein